MDGNAHVLRNNWGWPADSVEWGTGDGCPLGMPKHLWLSLFLGIYDLPDNTMDVTSTYKAHQIPKLKCFSSRLADVFDQSTEARC